ncbi:hypothetical protein [Rathayibacter oskolensis]|uniref:hypothetical protein n=1 Tax=Rathayibacter oskolensis TaxID=1891671 RepID=UPI003465A4AC
MRMGDRDRWVRTGTSWRDLGYLHYSHDYDERQIDVVRELQGILSGHSASSYYSPDTWLYLDQCRSEAIWAALHGAVRAGIGLVMGDRDQTPLRILDTTATASIDVTRTSNGLELRSLVAIGDHPAPEEFGFIGDPAVGLYTWEPGDELRARPVTLVPFAAPLVSSARTFLWSREAIRIPEQEESAFLTEHYQRLHRLFAIVSRDGSFEAPPVPEPRLGLTLEHTDGAGLHGTWWWRYGVEGARGAEAERLPLRLEDDPGYRDAEAEQRILDSLTGAGIDPESTPALVSRSSRRLRPRSTCGACRPSGSSPARSSASASSAPSRSRRSASASSTARPRRRRSWRCRPSPSPTAATGSTSRSRSPSTTRRSRSPRSSSLSPGATSTWCCRAASTSRSTTSASAASAS